MKKMPSPNKMLLSPSCPNLSQMGKQDFSILVHLDHGHQIIFVVVEINYTNVHL